MGVFSREISQLLKIHPPPSFRSHLSSSPMGIFLRDYGNSANNTSVMYDLRLIVAAVMIHQLNIRTCTAQKNSLESFIATFR